MTKRRRGGAGRVDASPPSDRPEQPQSRRQGKSREPATDKSRGATPAAPREAVAGGSRRSARNRPAGRDTGAAPVTDRRETVRRGADLVVEACCLLVVVFVTLQFSLLTPTVWETDKAEVLIMLAIVALAAWLVGAALNRCSGSVFWQYSPTYSPAPSQSTSSKVLSARWTGVMG